MSDSEDDNVLQSKIVKRRGRPPTSKSDQNNNENLSGNIKKIGRPVTVSVDGKNPNTAAYKKGITKSITTKTKLVSNLQKVLKNIETGIIYCLN